MKEPKFLRKPNEHKKKEKKEKQEIQSENAGNDKNNPLKHGGSNSIIASFLSDWDKCRDRHPGQLEVLKAVFEDKCQYVFYRSGRKGAKTTTGIDVAWKLANLAPNRVGYLCYPTIAQGIEVVWEERRLQTCDRKDDYMFDKYVEKVDDNKHILKFNNGSFIKLVGTWTEARGRGIQPDFIICDEIQDCSPEYIEAMDANLAAKEHSQCIFMGTPPKKRNHYEEWWDRVGQNSKGARFHYTSYDNVKLPHLKEWLDNKKIELITANKEDVWLREYMAEFCYSSSSRVLPDAKLMEIEEITKMGSIWAWAERIPVLAISAHKNYFAAILAYFIKSKEIFVVDHLIIPHVWDSAYQDVYPLLGQKVKNLQDFCKNRLRKIVWDESKSFVDIIDGFETCRKDIRWQERGIPLLRELMIKDKIHFSREVAEFALECQNLLQEETQKDLERNYPHICTLAMMVNEYFSRDKLKIEQQKEFDQFAAFREMGIPYTPKKKGKNIFTFGI